MTSVSWTDEEEEESEQSREEEEEDETQQNSEMIKMIQDELKIKKEIREREEAEAKTTVVAAIHGTPT